MNINEIKEHVDLHTLFSLLGIYRSGTTGNYHAPWRADKKPSLSVFDNNKKWKDHTDGSSGSCIDILIKMDRAKDVSESLSLLHTLFGLPFDVAANDDKQQNESKHEQLWKLMKGHRDIFKAVDYLTNIRKLPKAMVEQWKGKVFGFSDWTPPNGTVEDKEKYGDCVSFPLRNCIGDLVGFNCRYLAANHPINKRMFGEASKGFFYIDKSVLRANIIWFVESPIDALTLTAAGCPSVAFLSTSFVHSFSFSWLMDHQIVAILADVDAAGKEATRILYHRLLDAGITPLVVNWDKNNGKDPNEALQKDVHLDWLAPLVKKYNTDLLPVSNMFLDDERQYGRLQSWQCSLDVIERKFVKNADSHEELIDIAGFRIYRIDPIIIHDQETAFGGAGFATRQKLIHYRRPDCITMLNKVVLEKDFSKPDPWREFGFVHSPKMLPFALQALSKDMSHPRESVNVLGLVYVGKKIKLNDALSTFMDPEQCIYYRLRFPSGPVTQAAPILKKVGSALKDGLGLIMLGWHLGSFLKVYLGFWPHLSVIAQPSSGKTSFINGILAKLTNATCHDPSELDTSYRRMKLLSNHAWPVYIDESSRITLETASLFANLLNAAYQTQMRHHGEKGKFLIAAPCFMFGQDSKITDAAIHSKMIQFCMDHHRVEGGLFEVVDPFPCREFAEWLMVRWVPATAIERWKQILQALLKVVSIDQAGTDLTRFVGNYAAVLFALEELFAFAGFKDDRVPSKLVSLMTRHLVDTKFIRRESLAILSAMATEISNAQRSEQELIHFIEVTLDGTFLYFEAGPILKELNSRGYNFPVSTIARLIQHFENDGFLVERSKRKSFRGKSERCCVVLDLKKIEQAGVAWPLPELMVGNRG